MARKYTVPVSFNLKKRHEERISRRKKLIPASEYHKPDTGLNVTRPVPQVPEKLMTTIAEVQAR